MAKSSIDERTFKQVLDYHCNFIIPFQQRGYRWRVRNLLELLDDLIEFIEISNSKVYCLQPLAVSKDGDQYKVWDGQQRLTTLFLLRKALGLPNPYNFKFERDSERNRESFMSNPNFGGQEEKNIDLFYIGRAYQLFLDCIACNLNSTLVNHKDENEKDLFKRICLNLSNEKVKQNLINLLSGERIIRKGEETDAFLEFLWYEVEEDIATEIFRDINSGKISLTNSELIKAILLGESSSIDNKELAAVQFSEIEKGLLDDHFWYMIQPFESRRRGNYIEKITDLRTPVELRHRLMRMDLLFNLVAGVSYSQYQSDPIASFRYFFDHRADISILWKKVRNYFDILKSIYSNVEAYHYIGFLTYCKRNSKASYSDVLEYISLYKSESKSTFMKKIKEKISVKDPGKLDFNKQKEDIRRVLLLHNICTLLEIFSKQNKESQLRLDRPFEIFPFELLYRQTWNIEHISPATDNPLKKEEDRKAWLHSVCLDFPDLFSEISKLNRFPLSKRKELIAFRDDYNQAKETQVRDEAFDKLFTEIISAVEDLQGTDKIKEKYCIGNYVLLDEHTNKRFHNALFPTKRRIVIAASGHQYDVLDTEEQLVFVPPCTKAAFMKFYNTHGTVALTDWAQTDVNDYEKNIYDHIKKYIR